MALLEQIYRFKSLAMEVVGDIHVEDADTSSRVVLRPDGGSEFGPLPEPMPRFIMFHPDGRGMTPSGPRKDSPNPLTEELVFAGVQLLQLLDPRVYIRAEQAQLLQRSTSRDQGMASVRYDIATFGVRILGMPPEIAKAAALDGPDPYRTRFTINEIGKLEIRVNDRVIGENSFVEYPLPPR